ncbi:unnamed protein product [Eruca vesicaria subsp. sativa]|uniref:Uncharacterized protein n=1 Tax=Eruca vesicaria subsp. sativa TaxID=29727 RepID=A0ABC8LVW6_ERUVS|nr:unnamed protein product [Eruca vesicaria subsp. sativa]
MDKDACWADDNNDAAFNIDVAARNRPPPPPPPVEALTIPTIGASESVEAPGVEDLKELEIWFMNAIRDGLNEINRKVDSLDNWLTPLEKEVRRLMKTVPDSSDYGVPDGSNGGVLKISNQMQNLHAGGKDEEDGDSKDDGLEEEEDGGSKDDDLEEKEDGGSKDDDLEEEEEDGGSKDEDMAGEKEKESGDVQTKRKTKKRKSIGYGQEKDVAQKAKRKCEESHCDKTQPEGKLQAEGKCQEEDSFPKDGTFSGEGRCHQEGKYSVEEVQQER